MYIVVVSQYVHYVGDPLHVKQGEVHPTHWPLTRNNPLGHCDKHRDEYKINVGEQDVHEEALVIHVRQFVEQI